MAYGLTSVEFFLNLKPAGGACEGEKAEAGRPEPEVRSLYRHPLSLRHLRIRFAARPFEPVEPDLIDHPAFRGMSPRELADLPFPRHSMTVVAGG